MEKAMLVEVAENGFIVSHGPKRTIHNDLYGALKRVVICAYDSKGCMQPSTECMTKIGKEFIKEFGGKDGKEEKMEV